MVRQSGPCYEFGPFRLDVAEHMLLRSGQPVPLTPKIFAVLRVLVQNDGHLVEKEKLLKEVWPDSFVEEGTLNRSVSILRKALGDSPSGHRYIETVPKRGYRFVAPVAECLHADSEIRHRLHSPPDFDIEAAPSDSKSIPERSVPPPLRIRSTKRAAAIAGVLLIAGAISYGVVRPTEPRRNAAVTAAPAIPDASVGKAPATVAPVHRQVTFTGKEGAPTLAPDGRRVAYVSAGKPDKLLMVQELAGGQPLEVFRAPEIGHVRWSPDGSELLIWTRGAG